MTPVTVREYMPIPTGAGVIVSLKKVVFTEKEPSHGLMGVIIRVSGKTIFHLARG